MQDEGTEEEKHSGKMDARLSYKGKDIAQGWKTIYDFMFANDKRTYDYAVSLLNKRKDGPSFDEKSEDSSSQVSKIRSVKMSMGTSNRRSVSSPRFEMASEAMNLATIIQCRA